MSWFGRDARERQELRNDTPRAAVDTAALDALLDATSSRGLPAGYAAVDRVLTVLRAPASAPELAGETQAVAAFTAARRAPARRRVALPWSTSAGGRRPARVAVLVAASLVVLGGTAYAATRGSLPGPLQDVVHDALDQVGIHVPAGGDEPADGSVDAGDRSGQGNTGGNAPDDAADSGNGRSSGNAPGQSGDTPGQSGTAPGQSGTAPGQSGTAPGQSGDTPGQGGTPPGQGGEPPGQAKK